MSELENSVAPLPSNELAASFRDPGGRLLKIGGDIIRIINEAAAADLQSFLGSATAKRFIQSGQLVRTEFLSPLESEALLTNPEVHHLHENTQSARIVKHEVIPFASYPYEWLPEMLYAAASLTLDLAESLLKDGWGLKDATPDNILFRGTTPVFVDLLSFEPRDAKDPVWLASAQFERTFLLPLLVNKHFGIALDRLLLSRRDGLEPEDVYQLCGGLQKLSPSFLTITTLPTWLAKKHRQDDTAIYQKRTLDNAEKARFILGATFKRLRRLLKRVEPQGGKHSTWSEYMAANNYSQAHFQAKCAFVEQALREAQPRRVLDIGCNTGHFSVLAAKSGATVVAIDYDAVVAGEVWRKARAEKLDILPLRVDLSRPSPPMGWRNRECAGFLERARGGFDALLMLALIHHLLVSERIPLAEIMALAAELTTDTVIVEFIAPNDSMFRTLTRGRDHLFTDLTVESFEATCRRHFDIVRSQHEPGTARWLYWLRKKTEQAAGGDASC